MFAFSIFRKHSSGDLHSRLKTRKLLGVGETDDGDVHRSKVRHPGVGSWDCCLGKRSWGWRFGWEGDRAFMESSTVEIYLHNELRTQNLLGCDINLWLEILCNRADDRTLTPYATSFRRRFFVYHQAMKHSHINIILSLYSIPLVLKCTSKSLKIGLQIKN